MIEAKARGYEAHHIIPRSLQNEEDDRCVRLTPYEHIYAHYLLALENEEAVRIFFLMVNKNLWKLDDIEKITLQELEEYGRLRAEGKTKAGEINKSKKRSDDIRKKLSDAHKGHKHTEETKLKMSKSRLGKKHSEEWSRKIGQARKGIKHTEEAKAKMRGRKHTEEAKQKNREAHLGKSHPISDETKAKMSLAKKGRKYYTNGLVNKICFECPEGFWKGRI